MGASNFADSGYLQIGNEQDRAVVANILYKNGYTVSPVRMKKDGKSNIYYVKYERKSQDIREEDL